MRLQSALDNEVHVAIQRFAADGVALDVGSVYAAIQRSNSSLKRKPKKQLSASIERVLDFIGIETLDSYDSEAETEKKQRRASPGTDLMNRSLRTNLMPSVTSVSSSLPAVLENGTKKRNVLHDDKETIPKRQKPERGNVAPPSEVSLDDVGGMDDVIERMGEILEMPLLRPEIFKKRGRRMPKGILLHGPPGCGKTMIARAWSAELQIPFIEILGPSIVSSMSGDSEKGIRDRFEEAKKIAPCLLFIDELDAIAPKRDSSQSQMEKRIVAQLLVSMDDLGRDYERPVIVLAATNRPDTLDPALRRGGRFDTEINISVPNERVREQILRAQTRETPLAEDVDFRVLARMTAGFVGADLDDLVGKADVCQMKRYRTALSKQALQLTDQESMDIEGGPMLSKSSDCVTSHRRMISRLRRRDLPEPPGFENDDISMADFLAVLPGIIPSSKREGFTTIPDVSWEDVGALRSVREKLHAAIVEPIIHPERYQAFGIAGSDGVLLWGPAGCGKTLLAKAAAAECKANFISVKGPELVDKFVGESEAAVRRIFTRARSSVPCVIFFDEIDALAPRRGDDSGFAARVVGTLLTELDGLNDRAGIYVIGATNRPDMIDEALLRPGRLGKHISVGPPGEIERVEILKTLLRSKPVDNIMEISEIGRDCKGFSGADLHALLQDAVHCAIRRQSSILQVEDVRLALRSLNGSLHDMKRYEELEKKFGGK